MSLLLEALKKAEEAKRREEDGSGTEAVVPDTAPPAPPPRITPAHELELIDDEIAQAARFAGLDVPEPTPSSAGPVTGGSEAARLLFDAKRPPVRGSSLRWVLAGGAVLLLAVGAWVAWQVSSLEQGQLGMPEQHPPLPGAAATLPATLPAASPPVAADASVSTDMQAPLPVPALPADRPEVSAVLAATVDTARGRAGAGATASGDSSRFLSGQLAPSAPLAEPAPESAPAAPRIHITRNPPAVPQDVSDGYAAFQAGEFDRARAAYERALRSDPRNPDALHGLAALARRDNDESRSRQIMRRIAEVDPADAAARVALADNADPAIQEARLLDIVAAQPKSADAAQALGTFYASQSRWREAQQAWFNAYALAPDQPDHAYNLAVSLDHMRQPRLALQYYQEALALGARHPASFDSASVARRIATLQAPDGR